MSLSINNYNNNYSFRGRTVKTNKNGTQTPILSPSENKKATIAGAFATGLLTGIALKGKNAQNIAEKISSVTKEKLPELKSNVKKLWGKLTGSTKQAEEPRRVQLEEEWKAQERAKIQAEFEAKQAQLAEREAKIREQEAREAELKAQKEAQIKAEEAAKLKAQEKFQQKLASDFDKRFNLSIGEQSFADYPIELNQADAFETGIVGTLKKAEKEGIKEEQVKNLYKTITEKHIISDEQIEERAKNAVHLHGNERILTRHDLQDRKSLIVDLAEMQKTIPQSKHEYYSDYVDRLIQTRKTKLQEQEKQRIKNIRLKIRYEDKEPEEPELTDEEMKALAKWRPGAYDNLSKREALTKLSVNNHSWVRGYTGENKDGGVPEKIETIMLKKTFPKYNSEKYFGNKAFAHRPVARWIDVSGGKGCADYDIDRYVNETFKVGGKYTAPAKQSCSVDLSSANDADFCDEGYKDLKFIIHPLAKTSEAADLTGYARALRTRFGHLEVVYPKGTEFNVLDKRLEKVVHKNGTFVYRWVIEMQESPAAKNL